MAVMTIEWRADTVRMIDQRLLARARGDSDLS